LIAIIGRAPRKNEACLMDAIKYYCEKHWGRKIKAPQREQRADVVGSIIEKEERAERQRENIMRWNRIRSVFVYVKSIPRSQNPLPENVGLVGELLWSGGSHQE
jgi:hypothetical protein